MVEKREPTSGELTNLHDIAHTHLPDVIDVYGDCASTLKRVTEPGYTDMGHQNKLTDEEAFERKVPPPPGAPSYGDYTGQGEIYGAYVAARNEFHHLMALVATNLNEAANGFNQAYNGFKGTDEDNARDIDYIDVPEDFKPSIEQPTYPKAEG